MATKSGRSCGRLFTVLWFFGRFAFAILLFFLHELHQSRGVLFEIVVAEGHRFVGKRVAKDATKATVDEKNDSIVRCSGTISCVKIAAATTGTTTYHRFRFLVMLVNLFPRKYLFRTAHHEDEEEANC